VDVRNNRKQSTALAQHAILLEHNMDWGNSKILAYENNWHKRKFIEFFFINKKSNTIDARNSVKYLDIYQNMFEDAYNDIK